jgi:hypothetical protein
MKRDVEFKGIKNNSSGFISEYIYIRADEQRVKASFSLSGDNKGSYNISIWLGSQGDKPILEIIYPKDGLEASVTENFKKAKELVMPASDFLELISSRVNVIEVVDSTLIVRSAKKALSSEVNSIHTFKDVEIRF